MDKPAHDRSTTPQTIDVREERALAQALSASGLSGQATVVALRDTGTSVDGDPRVELDLLLGADGVAPYPVTVRQVVSRLAVARLQPGAKVHVRIDPVDQQRVIVA